MRLPNGTIVLITGYGRSKAEAEFALFSPLSPVLLFLKATARNQPTRCSVATPGEGFRSLVSAPRGPKLKGARACPAKDVGAWSSPGSCPGVLSGIFVTASTPSAFISGPKCQGFRQPGG